MRNWTFWEHLPSFLAIDKTAKVGTTIAVKNKATEMAVLHLCNHKGLKLQKMMLEHQLMQMPMHLHLQKLVGCCTESDTLVSMKRRGFLMIQAVCTKVVSKMAIGFMLVVLGFGQ